MKNKGWDRRKIVGEMLIKGFNGDKVAENVGCSRQWVSKVINKHDKRGGPTAYKIKLELSRMLDVPYEEIWGEEDPFWYSEYLI